MTACMLHNYIVGNSLIWAVERNNGVSPLTLLLLQKAFLKLRFIYLHAITHLLLFPLQ